MINRTGADEDGGVATVGGIRVSYVVPLRS